MSFYDFVPLGDTLKRKAIVSLYFFAFVLAPINCLWSKLTSDNDLSTSCLGYPRVSRRCLKFARHSPNVVFEEFVLSNLIASPLMKPQEGGTR